LQRPEWAAEYRLTKAEAANGFGATLRHTVNDGSLREAIDTDEHEYGRSGFGCGAPRTATGSAPAS
jgi:hypothetical protein